MLDRGNKTHKASVVFADIVEYSKKPADEQIRLKDEFNALISEVIKEVAPNDRYILDTGDGVAISFLGEPEEALFVAMNLRDVLAQNTSGLSARIGINDGPVRVVKDINGQDNIIGDGINVAQRVMSFAQPGEVLVSRSYYEIVSHLSREYSLLFKSQGGHKDKHAREHEVYVVGSPGRDIKLWTAGRKGKVRSDTATGGAADSGTWTVSADTVVKPKMENGKKILYAGGLLAVVVVLAFAFRGGNSEIDPSKPQGAAESKPSQMGQQQLVKPALRASAAAGEEVRRPLAAAQGLKPSSRNETSKMAEAPSTLPAGNTGAVALAIDPWGEVYLDGKKMGVSPPLKELQVTPGKHTIEIRNTSFASHTETLEVKLNDHVKIAHQFR